MGEHLQQGARSANVESFDHRGFGQVRVGKQDATILCISRGKCHGQGSPDRPQVSLEADLAQNGIVSEEILRELPARDQYSKGDGEI
jgi:hypothetical protein